MSAYEGQIENTYAACHGIGQEYEFNERIESHHILGALENIIDPTEDTSWIVNIDCDYFFSTQRKVQLYTDAVIEDIGLQVKSLKDANKLICCTIALSPECCGGWTPAERVAGILSEKLGVPFSLG